MGNTTWRSFISASLSTLVVIIRAVAVYFGETTFAHGSAPLHCKYAGELRLAAGLDQGVLVSEWLLHSEILLP